LRGNRRKWRPEVVVNELSSNRRSRDIPPGKLGTQWAVCAAAPLMALRRQFRYFVIELCDIERIRSFSHSNKTMEVTTDISPRPNRVRKFSHSPRAGFRRNSHFAIITIIAFLLSSSFVGSAGAVTKNPPDSISAWQSLMLDNTASRPGCFYATYPNTSWADSSCAKVNASPPMTVGSKYGDEDAKTGFLIGDASSSFTSETGFVSETDNVTGNEYWTLQLNSENFSTTCASYFSCSGQNVQGWEQFLDVNTPGSIGFSDVFIQYWMLNYISPTHSSCPTGQLSGGQYWQRNGLDCYLNGPAAQINGALPPPQSASNLKNLGIGGASNLQSSGLDSVAFCYSGTCVQSNTPDTVLSLYSHWYVAESNILGYGGGSQAVFNQGSQTTLHLTLQDVLYSSSDKLITYPSCYNLSYTGETNNLGLGTCTSQYADISFTESG
jgi:hypothetical protein